MLLETNRAGLELNPITLRFGSSDLEDRYSAEVHVQSLPLLRLAILSGIAILSIYFPIDRQILGEGYHVMWLIRAVLLIPIAVFFYIFTYSHYFSKYNQLPASLLVLAAGIAMCFGTYWYGETTIMYFGPGAIMCTMFGFVLLGLRFIPAVLTCWTIVLTNIVAILALAPPLYITLNAIQVLLISCSILTIGAYKTEKMSRLTYSKSSQLIQAQEQRQEAERKRIEWLEWIAHFFRHEVKTHIAGLKTSLEILTRHIESLPLQRYIDNAKNSSCSIDYILETVSYATSIESTFYKETSIPIALDEVVKEQVENYQDIYPCCKIIYETDFLTTRINGRKERIIQMLDNLVSNAVDYHKDGTPIVVSLSSKENVSTLQVVNEGPALPENKEVVFKLFSSFRTTESKRNFGIGLYVVKLIAERYAGNVEAENRKDVSGAIFRVILPRAT